MTKTIQKWTECKTSDELQQFYKDRTATLVFFSDSESDVKSMIESYWMPSKGKNLKTVFDDFVVTEKVEGVDFEEAYIKLIDPREEEINYHKHPKVSFKYTPNLIFLLCFRVESRESFGNIKKNWVPRVQEERGEDAKFFLIGTHEKGKKKARRVTFQEGEVLASELGTRYFESSSDDGDRLREIYHEAARQVLRREEEGEEDEEEGESRKRPFRKCEIL